MRIAHFIVLTAIAVPWIAVQGQRPQMPRVRVEPCGGYCHTVWASCRRVALRARPIESAPIVATVDSGQRVSVVAGERRTTSPGVVVVRRSFTLSQRMSGPEEDYIPPHPKRWRLVKGDTIYVVDEETDGDSYSNYVWVYRGREDTTAVFWQDEDASSPKHVVNAELVAEMEKAWWARVRGPGGALGWTRPGPEWSGTSYYDEPAERCARAPVPKSH